MLEKLLTVYFLFWENEDKKSVCNQIILNKKVFVCMLVYVWLYTSICMSQKLHLTVQRVGIDADTGRLKRFPESASTSTY